LQIAENTGAQVTVILEELKQTIAKTVAERGERDTADQTDSGERSRCSTARQALVLHLMSYHPESRHDFAREARSQDTG
jgi:hypothetical protein